MLDSMAVVMSLLATTAVPPALACPRGRQCVRFEGHVDRGARFVRPFGPGLTFVLAPVDEGWVLMIRDHQPYDDISRMTPPYHVPNPRQIEGWHFRNAANTGPNDGSLNAPQEERTFCFTPEVGRPALARGPGRDPAAGSAGS